MSAEARRETILAAALEVFAEQGRDGGRLREIAARAGITEPYLFRHFSSKAELYDAAVQQPLLKLVERFEQHLASIPDEGSTTSAELIYKINRVMLAFLLEAIPYIGVSMFSDTTNGSDIYSSFIYSRVHEPVTRMLRHIKGWPSPVVSLDLVAKSMWGMNYGVALDGLLTGLHTDVEKTAARLSRLYVQGIPNLNPLN